MSDPAEPIDGAQANTLLLPPVHVPIPWLLAYDIEALLRTAGFMAQADSLRTYITAAEQAARP